MPFKGLCFKCLLNCSHYAGLTLLEGKVPSDWSVKCICPIFKKGDRDSGNYRWVSFTSTSCMLSYEIMIKIIR